MTSLLIQILLAITSPMTIEDKRIGGILCRDETSAIQYLSMRARGSNDVMAAEFVNKRAGKPLCEAWIPRPMTIVQEKSVMQGGIVFKLFRLRLNDRPETELWSGTHFGVF